MAKSDIYEVSYNIDCFRSLSLQHQFFEKLLSVASQRQLIHFATNDNNAAPHQLNQVLRQKKGNIPVSQKQQCSKDITKVKMLKECPGEGRAVSSLANEDIFD